MPLPCFSGEPERRADAGTSAGHYDDGTPRIAHHSAGVAPSLIISLPSVMPCGLRRLQGPVVQQVKALNVTKNFQHEITCAAMWGTSATRCAGTLGCD